MLRILLACLVTITLLGDGGWAHAADPITIHVAAPLSGGDKSGSGFSGDCQSCLNAGMSTCNKRNPAITAKKVAAPLGQRSAVQASTVQPRIRQAALEDPPVRDQP